MAGDYILAIASTLIAGLKHDEVTLVLSQVSNRKQQKTKFKQSLPTFIEPTTKKLCHVRLDARNNGTTFSFNGFFLRFCVQHYCKFAASCLSTLFSFWTTSKNMNARRRRRRHA